MATRFAGSRHLDERRRRRLAVSADNESIVSGVSTELGPAASSEVTEGKSSHETKVSHFPLRKLISPKAWKLWGIGLIGFLVSLALLRAGQIASAQGSGASPEFVRLFHPTSGQALRVYGSLLFLLSGQLAMLIWWVRSCSPLDFAGRYRVWTRIAAAGLAAALLLTTDTSGFIKEQITKLTDISSLIPLELFWLIPVIGCAALFLWLMHQEMRENRLSLVMLWASAVCGLMTAWQSVSLAVPALAEKSELLEAGTALFAQLSLFMSLLFHTRYVIYISSDPPPKRFANSRFRLRRLHVSLPLSRKSQPDSDYETDDDSTLINAEETSEEDVQQPSGYETSSESEADAARPQLDGSIQSLRVDEPLDKELLKGLSKRERRKLRKEHRKMQRADRSELSEKE